MRVPGLERTSGFWKTEKDSAQAFDNLVEGLGLFHMHTEVEGRYQYLRPSQDLRKPRIDRILRPTRQLLDAGWTLGPVGVELKASDKALGRPVGQLISYSHATWKIGNTWIVPEWYFLWPVEPVKGNLESILAQQRCGGVYRDHYHRLTFHSTMILARLGPAPDDVDVRPDNTNHGRKVGSR